MKIWFKSALLPVMALHVACASDSPAQAEEQTVLEASSVSAVSEALTAGTYAIVADLDTSKCLDVAGNNNADGATVQLATCNGSAAQAWVRDGAEFKIYGNKCLNVKDGIDQDGTRLQIWTCDERNDVNARFAHVGNQVQWKGKNRCIDISGGRVQDGTPVQIWNCDKNNQNQRWQFNAISGSAPLSPRELVGAANPSTSTSTSTTTGSTPNGLDVAPYFWTWANGSNNYAIRDLDDARNKANMQSATIAFGLSGGGCSVSRDLSSMGDSIRSYIKNGGRVILSFGGAAGTYLEDTCNDSGQLANALDGQLKSLNTRALDFDIEGSHLATMNRTNILLDALKILQGRYSDLYVSFTLPVDDNSGLPGSALNVIKGANQKGLKVSRVNIMTMDFGHGPKPGQDFGDQCNNAAQATFNQLKTIYGNQADGAIWHMIGITPMIGENDDHFKMTTADASKVARFVKAKGIGMLSFWGMQRDRAGYGNLDDFSNVSQNNFDFLRIFNAAR